MTEVPSATFLNFFIFLLIPFLGGFIAKRFRFQPLIGYILGGVVIGNLFNGLISSELISNIANMGIIILLFMIGLEINFERLLVFKKFILVGGALQVGLSVVFVTIFSNFFGFSILQSFLIGIAVSSSSTILVAKIIQEKGEESSFIGELAMGILMFQDLAFIPFIIIFNYLNGDHLSAWNIVRDIGISTVQAGVILSLMFFIGKRLVPRAFDRVAKSSRELLNLFIIIFISLICYLSSLLGVPVLLSAFIAGILVSQTTEHYHIFSQLRPVRDIMAIIFFVFIGTHVPVAGMLSLIPKIAGFSFMILLIKFLIMLGVSFYFRFSSRIAFFLALLLFQIDEDAFILFSLGFSHKLFSYDQYIVLISTTIISLLVTPVFISRKEEIFLRFRAFLQRFFPQAEVFIKHRLDSDPTSLDELKIHDHVIICGYGRVGRHIGQALMNANIPFIAVDFNFHSAQKARREGINVIYGDSTDRDILDYAEIENAVALVSVVPDKYSQEAIILNAKKLNPKIVVMSRVHNHVHQQRMKDLGADVVIEPELEASLSIIKKLFYLKGVAPEDRVKQLHHFKIEQGMG